MDFMLDRGFLEEVNKFRAKTYYAAIMLLDFETERPITQLEGRVVNGSMSISSQSPTRRTGSLQIVFDRKTFDLTNMDNLIAINKKFSLSIGVNNPFYDAGMWREYPKILYWKQGTFLITNANSSMSTSGRTINLQFIDKMGMLNGVCGGTIPASVSLHDRIEIDPDDNVTTTYPRINQIIREVVHHFGEEHFSRIIVEDVPDFGRQVVTWAGTTPAWFAEKNGSFVVADDIVNSGVEKTDFPDQKILGDDIGYMATELTYPGELVMKAGTTVTAVLDEIVKTLGNFEYFYDVDGIFHFQQIRNFDKTGQAPLSGFGPISNTPFNITPELDSDFHQQYLPKFSNDQYLNEFRNSELVSQVSYNPAYANIKNDFVVWGSRKSNKGDERLVRYHLAIDERPKDDDFDDKNIRALCRQWIWVLRDRETKEIKQYWFNMTDVKPSESQLIEAGADWITVTNPDGSISSIPSWEAILHSPSLKDLPSGDKFNWREELYRRALRAWGASDRGSYYDEELMAEWRLIFNPFQQIVADDGSVEPYANTFQSDWENHFERYDDTERPPWNGYNVDIIRKPQNIRYWLDLIDTNSNVGQYSVKRIGRRSVIKENNKINEVLNREVPAIAFIDGTRPTQEIADAESEFQAVGQKYCVVKADYLPYFELRNSFGSCYEEVRDLFHMHLIYTAQASLTSIPIFYLDVNRVIRLNFPELGVVGNFVINTISWNLGNMATMQMSLNEAVVIV